MPVWIIRLVPRVGGDLRAARCPGCSDDGVESVAMVSASSSRPRWRIARRGVVPFVSFAKILRGRSCRSPTRVCARRRWRGHHTRDRALDPIVPTVGRAFRRDPSPTEVVRRSTTMSRGRRLWISTERHLVVAAGRRRRCHIGWRQVVDSDRRTGWVTTRGMHCSCRSSCSPAP